MVSAKRTLAIFCAVAALAIPAWGQTADYRDPGMLGTELHRLARETPGLVQLHELATTPGGRELLLVEIGAPGDNPPGVLVVANMEGNSPPATEAARKLIDQLLGDWQEETEQRVWYVLPLGNPDGYARFFAQPQDERAVNERPVNDDNDDTTDEDGPEDLNGDGLITQMRQKHPDGSWLTIEGQPVLMKKAETGKGESGVYRLLSEGIDNDGDGRINEDGPGGANPGWNFPHAFKHYTTTNGLWAASEVESRAVLEFAFAHPQIALVITLGQSNSLRKVPEGSGAAKATQNSYKLPERMAKRMGVDPNTRFTMPELLEMARDYTGYQDITEDQVLQFLGVGAATKPNQKDVPYWTEIADRYKKFIEEQELDGERLDSRRIRAGAVEDWAYYQFGVPSFSLDFWTVPVAAEEPEEDAGELTPDAIEKMSSEEFIELGEEKIDAFLKASDAPPQYSAAMVIEALQGGMLNTEKIAEFVRKEKKKSEAGGADETEQALYDYDPATFVVWETFDHPTLGEVEIGGQKPYVTAVPPAGALDSLLDAQLPFIRELVSFLPELVVDTVAVTQRADGIWKIEAWIANRGYLPYPTHQGERCKRPAPAAATLSVPATDVLEGRPRQVVGLLSGSGGAEKVTWLVRARAGASVTVSVMAPGVGRHSTDVVLEGGVER